MVHIFVYQRMVQVLWSFLNNLYIIFSLVSGLEAKLLKEDKVGVRNRQITLHTLADDVQCLLDAGMCWAKEMHLLFLLTHQIWLLSIKKN